MLLSGSDNDSWILIVQDGIELEKDLVWDGDCYLVSDFGIGYPRRTLPKGTIATFIQDKTEDQ